jgi:hypothetical protein
VDSQGNVYVSERDNRRIQKFTADGAFLTSWGSQGTGDGQFGSPSDVTVDPSGNAYVLDRSMIWPRIQKFVETRGNLSVEGNVLARNAGIGTTNPERWRLTIQGGERISFKDTTGTTKWHINDWSGTALGSGDFNIAETGVADGRLYLRAGGNVGIGTTSPPAKLTIAESGDLLFRASSQIPQDPGDVVFQTFAGVQKGRIWSNPGAGAGLNLSSADNTPRIAIDSVGGVDVTGVLRVGSQIIIGNGTPFVKVQAGTGTVGPGGPGQKVVTVNFTRPFSSAPRIIVTPRAQAGTNWPDVFAMTVRSATSTQFQVTVQRLDLAAAWGQNLQLDWIAWEQAHAATAPVVFDPIVLDPIVLDRPT